MFWRAQKITGESPTEVPHMVTDLWLTLYHTPGFLTFINLLGCLAVANSLMSGTLEDLRGNSNLIFLNGINVKYFIF